MSAAVDDLFQICTCRSFREIKQKPAVLYRNCASSLCCFLFGENKQKPAVLYRNCASSLCCFLFGENKQKPAVLYRNCASSLCCFLFGENKQKPAVLYRNCASSLCFLFGENKQKPAVLYRNCASSLCCFLFGENKQKPAVLYRNCASSLCFLFGENKQKPAVLYRSYASSFLLFSVWGEQAETGCFIQKLRVITLLFYVWVSPNRKQQSDDHMSEMSKNSLRTKDLQSDDAETSRNRLFYTEAMHHHFCCFLFLSAGPAISVTTDTTLKSNYVSVAIIYLMFAPLTDSWR